MRRIRQDRPQARFGVRRHGDVSANDAPHQQQQVLEHRGKVELIGLQHLPPAERQQFLRQRRGALGGAADLRRLFANGRIRRRVLHDQARVTEDGGQHVVEVVGDAAGQLADGFHLLRLGELAFEPPLPVLHAALAAGEQPPAERYRHQQRGHQRQLPGRGSLDLSSHVAVLQRRSHEPRFVGHLELRPGVKPAAIGIIEVGGALLVLVVVRVTRAGHWTTPSRSQPDAKVRGSQADDQPPGRQVGQGRSQVDLDQAIEIDHQRHGAIEVVARVRVLAARRKSPDRHRQRTIVRSGSGPSPRRDDPRLALVRWVGEPGPFGDEWGLAAAATLQLSRWRPVVEPPVGVDARNKTDDTVGVLPKGRADALAQERHVQVLHAWNAVELAQQRRQAAQLSLDRSRPGPDHRQLLHRVLLDDAVYSGSVNKKAKGGDDEQCRQRAQVNGTGHRRRRGRGGRGGRHRA